MITAVMKDFIMDDEYSHLVDHLNKMGQSSRGKYLYALAEHSEGYRRLPRQAGEADDDG